MKSCVQICPKGHLDELTKVTCHLQFYRENRRENHQNYSSPEEHMQIVTLCDACFFYTIAVMNKM